MGRGERALQRRRRVWRRERRAVGSARAGEGGSGVVWASARSEATVTQRRREGSGAEASRSVRSHSRNVRSSGVSAPGMRKSRLQRRSVARDGACSAVNLCVSVGDGSHSTAMRSAVATERAGGLIGVVFEALIGGLGEVLLEAL